MKESRDNSLVIQRGDEGGELTWGSDIIADVLRALEYEYVAVCPGSSFRGLHESIVNHLSNHTPEMLLCLHEEHAVAMAHGFAKVCGRPMPVILHCNVGLMHASMAIFNAWCDRMPVVVLAGSGPVDSIKRRTPVDWLHASIDQASIVRDYTKWDDLPLCPEGAVESILRAHQIAQTAPQGPTVVTLDQRMQEELFQGQGTPPDVARFKAPAPASPNADLVTEAAFALANAKSPLILAGRVSRSQQAWDDRVQLAELLGAPVLTDMKTGAAFPTDHPLHVTPPALVFTDDLGVNAVRNADVILSLDWADTATLFKQAYSHPREVTAKVIQVSVDRHVHRGWSRDYQRIAPIDLELLAEPDATVPLLLEELRRIGGAPLKQAAAARMEQHSSVTRSPQPVPPVQRPQTCSAGLEAASGPAPRGAFLLLHPDATCAAGVWAVHDRCSRE